MFILFGFTSSLCVKSKFFSTVKINPNVNTFYCLILIELTVAILDFYTTGISYHEKCYCPIDSIDEWLDQMSCPPSIRQIKRDLSIFSKMDFKPIAEELVERFGRSPGSMAVSHYVIKNNKVCCTLFSLHNVFVIQLYLSRNLTVI